MEIISLFDPAPYFVPLPETEFALAMEELAQGCPDPDVNEVRSITSISIGIPGTIIYYDHWEDGYEVDLENPVQSTTEIWGDGILSNGVAPWCPSDIFSSGDIVNADNIISTPRNPAVFYIDGLDKIGSSRTLSVIKTGYSDDAGPLLGGALEVIEISQLSMDYIVSVGEDFGDEFENTGLIIQGIEDGTFVSVDANADGDFTDGNDVDNQLINAGGVIFVPEGVNGGAIINSNNPIQTSMFSGDVGSCYALRTWLVYPENLWDCVYYSPVPNVNPSEPAKIYLRHTQNSSVLINMSDNTGLITPINVPVSTTVEVDIPEDSGVKFESANGCIPFTIFESIDSETPSNGTRDWGFSPVPESKLKNAILVGWGPGSSDLTQNGNPVWVTVPNSTTIYYKFNGL